jgi:hypothetical protein
MLIRKNELKNMKKIAKGLYGQARPQTGSTGEREPDWAQQAH